MLDLHCSAEIVDQTSERRTLVNEDGDIDAELIRAVANGDHQAVIRIYADAAQRAEKEGDMDHACFLMTHAWVFALEAGDDAAEVYKQFLTRTGRV